MQITQPQTVFVILTGAAAPSGLARAAVRNGWPILEGPLDAVQLHQALARGTSGVAIVHIPVPHVAALEMIRAFQASWRCAIVIAVGAVEWEHDEILVRAAGAALWLPESADADQIERTVRALVVPAGRRARRAPGPACPVERPRSRNAG